MGGREREDKGKDQVRGQDMGSLLVQTWTFQRLQGQLWMEQNEVTSWCGERWGSKVTAEGLSRLSAIRGGVWCCGGRAPPTGGGSPGSLRAFRAL